MLPLLLWSAVHCILVGYPVAGTNRDSFDVSHDKAEGDKDGYTYSYYGVAPGMDGNHITTGSGRDSRSKSLDGWLECSDGSEPQLPGGQGVQYWHYEPESYHNDAYYSHGMSSNGMLYNTSRPSGLRGAVLNTTMGHYSFYANGSRYNHSVDNMTMRDDHYNHGRGRGLNTTMGNYSLYGNGSRSGLNGSVFGSTWQPDERLERDMYNEYHGLHHGNTSRHGWNGSIMNWSSHGWNGSIMNSSRDSNRNVSSFLGSNGYLERGSQDDYRSYHDNNSHDGFNGSTFNMDHSGVPTCSDGSRAQMLYVAAVKVTNQTISRKRRKREGPIRLAIALVVAGLGVALVCSLGFAAWACKLRGKVRCLESKLRNQTAHVIGVPLDVEQPRQTLSNISKPPIYV